MLTESELKLRRYSEKIVEVDKQDRRISVRRLRPSEQTKIAGMTAELSGSDELMAADGSKVLISHRSPLLLAASVCMINDDVLPFPRNRGELDAVLDRLDMEGMAAAGIAISRLLEGENSFDALDAAKNLQGTPPSG